MTIPINTVHKVYHWEEQKGRVAVPPKNKYALAAIDLACRALSVPEDLSCSVPDRSVGLEFDNYKAPPNIDIRFFNDCVYKDIFGVCFHKVYNFDSEELERIVAEVLCFFNTLGFPMSVMVTYFRAKTRFSNESSLTIDMNFRHCYDNAESRDTFSGRATSKRVPAPQTYF